MSWSGAGCAEIGGSHSSFIPKGVVADLVAGTLQRSRLRRDFGPRADFLGGIEIPQRSGLPHAPRAPKPVFHQFSPVFTSLWGAVELNAVQTKYDIDRGALAG